MIKHPTSIYRFPRTRAPLDIRTVKELPHRLVPRTVATTPQYLVGTDDGMLWGRDAGTASVRTGDPNRAVWWATLGNAAAFATGRVSIGEPAVLYIVEGLWCRPYLIMPKKGEDNAD